ncbi:MAG: AAA family ATPase [Tannerellaceae bacterium]|jgi:exodeoxyribonuclease-5|nr:AAA family ATPase [Tannerellaceae bacterium]
MANTSLDDILLQHFRHTPTGDQITALHVLSGFLYSCPEPNSLLLLRGYAGTGKTSLVGALVKALDSVRIKSVLLAPTGRAAKVFSLYAGHKAFTIHKKIYRQKSFQGDTAGSTLNANLHRDTLFIVDEASMIANRQTDGHSFGSGNLLDDLVHYVYSGDNCRMILMGDEAQLPPVMLDESPALDCNRLSAYNLRVYEASLTQVVRQDEDSGILLNATLLRETLRMQTTDAFPRLRLKGYKDLRRTEGGEAFEDIASAYSRDGTDDTMVIVRSNKQANRYNNIIRNRILYCEDELTSGDRLMVTRNNYHWAADSEEMDFIANGEIVRVLRVRQRMGRYGFRFADVSVRFLDYDLEIDIKILLDTLHGEAPTLSREESDKLFNGVMESYSYITTKPERIRKLKEDPFYNVVQVKYAYAVTCHKAQGGQWSNVFLDIGFVNEDMLGESFYRWLYTAITRASCCLYLINLPDEMIG